MVIGIDGRAANEASRSGVGRYCYELLQRLAPYSGDIGFRIYLDRTPQPFFPIQDGSVEIRVLPRKRGWLQRVLGHELRSDPPDVFFAPVMQVPFFVPPPVVVAIHDLACFDYGRQFTWSTRYRTRILARYAVRRAQHVLAISDCTKHDLIRRFPMPSERVTVTPLGVADEFRKTPSRELIQEVRDRLALPDRYILYVGRLQPRKNIVRLIDAFAALRRDAPDIGVNLVIAGGRGWMYDEIYERARRSPVANSIQFLGYVGEMDLPALVAGAEAFVLVSLWEGFGIPVVEAMASGTAVITSNTSSLPEVVGDAGITVDPYDENAIADALRTVLENDELRSRLEAKGRERSKQFTWERCAKMTFDALAAVADTRH